MHFIYILLATVLLLAQMSIAQTTRPKLLVLTDIGGDPDDQQSLVRLMAMNNEFDIVGLIATSRMGHGKDTKPEIIREVIEAYGTMQANFAKHTEGYATKEQLLGVVKSGTGRFEPKEIAKVFGEGKSTEASEWIIRCVDATSKDRPVNISIWGGSADLAQALDEVKRTRSPEQVNDFISKIVVHACADQDACGAWINSKFPQLRYLLSDSVVMNGRTIGQSNSTRGMYQNETRGDDGNAVQVVPKEQFQLVQHAWLEKHILLMGSLGAQYPAGPSKRYEKGIWPGPTGAGFPNNVGSDGLKEGDTPTWFYFLNNGLHIPSEPTFGGWGGRFVRAKEGEEKFVCARDAHPSGRKDAALETVWTVARWREAFQNEFATRMKWGMTSNVSEVNHPPIFAGKTRVDLVRSKGKAGQTIKLYGGDWTDPDGDQLAATWWFYPDPSTPDVKPQIRDADWKDVWVTLPDAPGAQLHFVMEIKDLSAVGPSFTRYRRTVVTVE